MADTYDLQEGVLPWQEVKAANGMFRRDGCIYRPELTPWTRALLEEANSRLESSEIFLFFLCNPKVRYRVHKSQPLVPVLSQSNPIHILSSYIIKIHINVIVPSTTRYSK
jgi:hypothetical protein